MLSDVIRPGCKIELSALERKKYNDAPIEKRAYQSQVYDILSEDRLEIQMPMEKTKLVLLSADEEFEVTFYADKNLYQCNVRVVDRYKSNNVYLLTVEMTSSLRKRQRREYYRYNCAIEIKMRPLEEAEARQLVEKKSCELIPNLPCQSGVMVDISGGGARFMTSGQFEKDAFLCCYFKLMMAGGLKEYGMIGRVLSMSAVPNRQDVYEHRVKFIHLNLQVREEIIKYIFEEERRNRKRELGE